MAEVMQVREAYRVEQWRQLMQQRKDSPLNNREFCAQQGISEKSYYYGCRSIRDIAARRRGLCTFETKGGRFILRVVIPDAACE